MKKKRPDSALLADIENAATSISQFVSNISRPDFEQDIMKQSAVLYQLAVIGEATKNLSMEFRTAHPETPWKTMAGMRDILIHAYHEMDTDTVWKTVTNRIPQLITQIARYRTE
jgi:uncharacterized protein with HEPN domain